MSPSRQSLRIRDLLSMRSIPLVAILASPFLTQAQPGALDHSFAPYSPTYEQVEDFDLQEDGRILICGSFTSYGGSARVRVARLEPDGRVDESFDPGTGPDGIVQIIRRSPTGTVVIAGRFNFVAGVRRLGIALLNSDGTLDTGFDPGGDSSQSFHTLSVQADGQILAYGTFWGFNGSEPICVRLRADGSADPAFMPMVGQLPLSFASLIEPDDKIVFAGRDFFSPNQLVRLQSDGSFDPFSVPRFSDSILDLASHGNGKLTIVGSFLHAVTPSATNAISRNRIARLNPDGILDLTFDPGDGFNADARGVSIRKDGRLIAGGAFTSYNRAAAFGLASLHADGAFDNSFSVQFSPGASYVDRLLVQPDGKLLIAGVFYSVDGFTRFGLARLHMDDLVLGPPQVTVQPTNRAVVQGQNVSFFAAAASYVRPLFQWRRDGTNLPTATNAFLVLSNVVSAQARDYDVVISNPLGAVTSSVARLDVLFAPFFVTAPTNLTVDDGQEAVFSASAAGNPLPEFKWRFNGTNLTSETNDTLRLARAAPSAAGRYSVVASNSIGSVVSTSATLTVRFAPVITSHPTSLVVNAGQSAVFLVSAQAVPSPAYQWQVNRTNLPNRVFPSLFLANVSPDQAGPYRVVVSNELDTAVSVEAMLTVNTFAPSILAQPTNQTAAVGRTVIFSVGVTAAPPPSFQWKFNDTDLSAPSRSTLTLTNIQFTNAGSYSVMVSNSEGVVTSALAILNVTPASTNSGAVDVDFNPGTGANDSINALALQADGKILIGGAFVNFDGTNLGRIARLSPTGTVDLSFNAGAGVNATINTMSLLSDGRIMIAGSFVAFNGASALRLARLNEDGSLDASFAFANNNYSSINALGVQSTGRILYGGRDTDSTRSFLVEGLRPDGSLDSHFAPLFLNDSNPGGTGFPPSTTYGIYVTPDDSVLAGGDFGLAKLQPHGSRNISFTNRLRSGLASVVRVFAAQSDGKILVGGSFTNFDGMGREGIVRLNRDGSRDATFNPEAGVSGGSVPSVNAIAVQQDGKILLGGAFSNVNGMARSGIARLNADGTLDADFDSTLTGAGAVNAIAIQPDGKVVIAGTFTKVNDVPRRGIARLHGDPATVPIIVVHPSNQTTRAVQTASFSAQVRCVPAAALQWQFNGTDLTGATNLFLTLYNVQETNAGNYALKASNVLGVVTSQVAVLTVALERTDPGSVGAAFFSAIDGTVRCTAEQEDGRILIGGSFTHVDRVPRGGIARLLPDGHLDASFDPGTGIAGGFPPTVYALAAGADGKIYIGGTFTNINGIPRNRIARLNADGSLDAGFDSQIPFGGTPPPTVYSLAVQPGGNVIVAGDFSSVGGSFLRQFLARFHSNGVLDTNFNLQLGGSSPSGVYSVIVQGDGKILIGGKFTFFGSPYILARLNENGSRDTSFSWQSEFVPGLPGSVRAIGLEKDGKILVGGNFEHIWPAGGPAMVRLLPNGSRDTNFFPRALASGTSISALAAHNCGAVLLAGSFRFTNQPLGTTSFRLLRLSSAGEIDPAFVPGLIDGDVWSILLRRNHSVLIGGDFLTVDGAHRPGIAGLHGDPLIPPPIFQQPISQTATGGYSVVLSVGVTDCPDYTYQWQVNGTNIPGATGPTLTLSNVHVSAGGIYRAVVNSARGSTISEDAGLTVNREPRQPGSADIGFYPPAAWNNWVKALALQPDGKLIAGGNFTNIAGALAGRIARFHMDGSLDFTFVTGSGFNSEVSSIAMQPDGKIVVGGGFTQANGQARNRVARIQGNGLLETNGWSGLGANDYVTSIAMQREKILMGGFFTVVGNVGRSGVARLQTNGMVDTNFAAGGVRFVMALAVQDDGKVLIGGTFTNVGQTARSRIARLHIDGAPDMSFDPGSGVDNTVNALTVANDGKVIIGGGFSSVNGTPRNRVARLHPDGTLDMTFDPAPGPNVGIWAVAVQPDGKVLVGGSFNFVSGMARNRIARLNVDGSLDTSFDPGAGANNQVFAITIHPGGKIFIGGSFTAYAGYPRDRIARLNGELMLFHPAFNGNNFSASLFTFDAASYALEFKESLEKSLWTPLPVFLGDGKVKTVIDPSATSAQRVYRVWSEFEQ